MSCLYPPALGALHPTGAGLTGFNGSNCVIISVVRWTGWRFERSATASTPCHVHTFIRAGLAQDPHAHPPVPADLAPRVTLHRHALDAGAAVAVAWGNMARTAGVASASSAAAEQELVHLNVEVGGWEWRLLCYILSLRV